MRVLVFSDLHLHNWPYGSAMVNGMNSRLEDGADVLKQIADYITCHDIDQVVFGGDLFHTHGKLDAAVLKVAYEGMMQISTAANRPADVYALVGNHDTSDKSMQVHAMHWLEGLGINVVDEPYHNGFNGLPRTFSFMPYTEDPEALKKFFHDAAGMQGDKICFLHQGVAGTPMGSGYVINEIFEPDMVPDNVKHVFSGHYHRHNKATDKITTIGSPMQLTWADSGDKKGFLVFDTDNPADFEFVPVDAPRFITFDQDGRGSADYVYQERLGKPGLFANNFIRVVNYNSTMTEQIREGLTGAGARSVEFVVRLKEADRLRPLDSDELHIPELIKEYEAQKEVTPERSEIGKELRE